MFFLSKLLPLFIYPVGLSCLLIGLSLLWLWKHPKRATWSLALALFILYVCSNPVVSRRFVSTLERQYLPPDPVPTADAIVVLGGATGAQLPPRPWVEVSEQGDRILYGARLYNQGSAPKLVLSGGRIPWRGGSGASEADDMKAIALAMNVPEDDILLEGDSLNTRQNAVNTQPILEDASLDSILLVTSAIHMPRSVAIFRKLGINVTPAPTDYLYPDVQRGSVTIEARILSLLPDARALDQVTMAIKEYVGFVIYRLRGWV